MFTCPPFGFLQGFAVGQVSGLIAHYDFSDPNNLLDGGVPVTDGGNPDTLVDLSGNGFNVVADPGDEATWNANQQNGLGTLDFDNAASDCYETTFGSNVLDSTLFLTVFVVGQLDDVSQRHTWIEISTGSTNEGMNFFQNTGAGGVNMYYRSGDHVGAGSSAGASVPHSTVGVMELWTGRSGDTDDRRKIFLDGVEVGTDNEARTDLACDTISIGCLNGQLNLMDGKIAEILVYNDNIADANQQAIEQSLRDKWGI